MRKIYYIILFLLFTLFYSNKSIIVNAHSLQLDIQYDDCIPSSYVDSNEIGDGYDEKWYDLVDNSNVSKHLSHEVQTIKYYFNPNVRGDKTKTWEALLGDETTYFINKFKESMEKWNDVSYFNGSQYINLINISEGSSEDYNVIIYPKMGVGSIANTKPDTKDPQETVVDTLNNILHKHYGKWEINVNIEEYQNMIEYNINLKEFILERTGCHEIGHILGLNDIDLIENSNLSQYHHEELLMGYSSCVEDNVYDTYVNRQQRITYKDIAGVLITRGIHTDSNHNWLHDSANSTQGNEKLICSICNGVKYVDDVQPYNYNLYLRCNSNHDLNSNNMMIVAKYGDFIYKKCKYCRYVPVQYKASFYNEGNFVTECYASFDYPSITLPKINTTKNHYEFAGWKKANDSNIYSYDSTFDLIENVCFEACWAPIDYTITYENLLNTNNNNNPYSYNIESDTIILNDLNDSAHSFKGWYSDIYFTNKVTSIPQGSFGNKMLFAKWSIEKEYVRNSTYTISDSSWINNSYDTISILMLTGFTKDQLLNFGYDELLISFTINIWEVNDGYQKIFLYDGDSSNNYLLKEINIQHGIGFKNTETENYEFSYSINLNDLSSNIITIAYTATGAFNNQWNNDGLLVDLVFNQTKAIHDHEYDYEWKSLTNHNCICECGHTMLSGHAVRQGDLNGSNTATCLLCKGQASMGMIYYPNSSNEIIFVTINGSYILPNGVIVLVEEDIESYLDGTLQFYDKNLETV